MEQNNLTLGKRIMALRKGAGMTQEQLAERLGISPQAVSKWENDISCPDISMLPALASLFDISVDALLGVTQKPGKAPLEEPERGIGGSCDKQSDPLGENERENGRQKSGPGGILWGIMLMGIGLVFLLCFFLGLAPNVWDIVWPAVLLGCGIAWFIRHLAPLGLGLAFVGFYYLLFNLGQPLPFTMRWDLIWPVGLILLGLEALLDACRVRERWTCRWGNGHCERTIDYKEENGFLQVRALFAEDNRRIRMETLQGGEIQAVFAGGKLDLTPVKALGNKGAAILHLHVVFAGYSLYVPGSMRVENRIHAVFGGVEIHGSPQSPTSTLTLTGDVVFGGLDIHYFE